MSSSSISTASTSHKENFTPKQISKLSPNKETLNSANSETAMSVQERMKLFSSLSMNSFQKEENTTSNASSPAVVAALVAKNSNQSEQETPSNKLSQIGKVQRKNLARFQTQVKKAIV